jgi:hypothetical protein
MDGDICLRNPVLHNIKQTQSLGTLSVLYTAKIMGFGHALNVQIIVKRLNCFVEYNSSVLLVEVCLQVA